MNPMEPMKLAVSSDPGLNRSEAMDPMEVMKLEVSCTLSLSMDEPLKLCSVGVVALLARGRSSAASVEHEPAASLVPPELPPCLSPLPSGLAFVDELMPAWEPSGVAHVLPRGMWDSVHPHLAPFHGEHEGETYAGHRAQLALATSHFQATWGDACGIERIQEEEPKPEALRGKPYSHLASGESATVSSPHSNFFARGAVAEVDTKKKQVEGENRRKSFNGRGRREIRKPSLMDIAKRMQEASWMLSGELEGIREPNHMDLARRVGLLSCQELLKCYELKGIRKPSLMDLARQVQEAGGVLSGPELLKCYEQPGGAEAHVTSWDASGIGRNQEEPEPILSKPYSYLASGESATESPPDDNSSPLDSASEVDTETDQVEGEERSSRFNECEPIRNHSIMDRAGCRQGAGGLSSPELKKRIAESKARFCLDCGSTVHTEGTFCHHCGVKICGR